MPKLTEDQIERATDILFERTSTKAISLETLEILSDALQRPWNLPSDNEWSSIGRYLGPGGFSNDSKAVLIEFVSRRNAALLQKRPNTLDVRRAAAWLEKNHPNESSRHIAELLHDYSLSIEGPQK